MDLSLYIWTSFKYYKYVKPPPLNKKLLQYWGFTVYSMLSSHLHLHFLLIQYNMHTWGLHFLWKVMACLVHLTILFLLQFLLYFYRVIYDACKNKNEFVKYYLLFGLKTVKTPPTSQNVEKQDIQYNILLFYKGLTQCVQRWHTDKPPGHLISLHNQHLVHHCKLGNGSVLTYLNTLKYYKYVRMSPFPSLPKNLKLL